MSPKQIHDAFDALLGKSKEAHVQARAAGLSSQQAATYRYVMRKRQRLKLETKLYWLRKAGMQVDDVLVFTRNDMVSFAKFAYHPKNKTALTLGWDYLLEKWQAIPKKPRP